MEKIWENISTIKDKVTQYAEIAKQNNWITKGEYENILEKICNDTLTIAVIGQMKSGKSTFLNAFLFRDLVLPQLSAALSVITYGQNEEVTAEFYTLEEWEEIKKKALIENDEDDFDIKAAKELVERSISLKDQLKTLLGKTQTAKLNELPDYISGDGKFSSITKSVTISLNDNRLKGVRIVDTPGFNDPVVSREEKTRAFLSEADVVILLLYAGRAFDESDKDILFDKVKNVGTGKIIIGVNKYDIELANGEPVEKIKNFVKDNIKKAVKEKNDPVLNQLLTNSEPILLSANMALIGIMPFEKVMKNNDLKWHYEEICKNFNINSQEEILEMSRVSDLEEEINNILSGEKLEILVRRPMNRIQAGIDAKKTEFETKSLSLLRRSKMLSASDSDLYEKQRAFNKAKKRTERIIERKDDEINDDINKNIDKTIFDLKKLKKRYIDQFHSIIDREKKPKKIAIAIESKHIDAVLEIESSYRDIYTDIKSKFKEVTNETINDLDGILADIADDDDEWEDQKNIVIKSCRDELKKFDNLSFEDMFTSNEIKEKKKKVTFWSVLGDIGTTLGFGLIGLGLKKTIESIIDRKRYLEDAHRQADALLPMDQIEETFEPIRKQACEYISFFKTVFLNDLLNPLVKTIEDMQTAEFNRENELKNIENELLKLKEDKALIESQLLEVEKYISEIALVELHDDKIQLEYNPQEKSTKLTYNGKNIELPCIGSGKNINLEDYIDELFFDLKKSFRLGKGARKKLVFYGTEDDFQSLLAGYHEFSESGDDTPDFILNHIAVDFQ